MKKSAFCNMLIIFAAWVLVFASVFMVFANVLQEVDVNVWWVLLLPVGFVLFMYLASPTGTKEKEDYPNEAAQPRIDRDTDDSPRSKSSAGESTNRQNLLVACFGDRERMERLIQYEKKRAPGLSEEEAVLRALERIERDGR